MMIAIVAADQNWGIGKDGQLLCPISSDLKRFKALTMGKVLIYGRKTLDTFPGRRVLPGRMNLIMSRSKSASEIPGSEIFRGKEELLNRLEELRQEGRREEEFCVIGGASIYALFLPEITAVELTRIHETFDADAYFPNLEHEGFRCVHQEDPITENGTTFHYERWERKR